MELKINKEMGKADSQKLMSGVEIGKMPLETTLSIYFQMQNARTFWLGKWYLYRDTNTTEKYSGILLNKTFRYFGENVCWEDGWIDNVQECKETANTIHNAISNLREMHKKKWKVICPKINAFAKWACNWDFLFNILVLETFFIIKCVHLLLKEKTKHMFKPWKTKTEPKEKAKGPLKSRAKNGHHRSHPQSRGTVLKVLAPVWCWVQTSD